MTKQVLISLSLLLLFFFHCTKTTAQSPAQAAAAPTNVTKILEKASAFSVFIRLLKSTSVSIQIENQLNVSNSLTIFAPTNVAFSALKPGTLNSLSTEQKVQLVQYHILPSFVSLQNFQTLSNPVRTQASNTHDYPLNVTVEGSWVNISTGIVNTTISATVYEDNQLAIYKVDKVLLPLGLFAPRRTRASAPVAAAAAEAPAPTFAVSPKEFPTSSLLAPAVAALLNDASGAFSLMISARNGFFSVGVTVFGAVISLLA
ncbi:fasciclin-like arabinogalactan protein 11 [Morus notabilis]|uniref:fasciclin-like arabinogalactan protein 11 n=1 Tax=Morus notabilis TaxID=981085 RepID=UPI000CED5263|nr:fasciclin-like arabinogalactan protein 11 [Morus notabilis]